MAETVQFTARYCQLYDTEANWQASDPVLNAGELAVSSDKNKIKIGDGTKKWSELSYSGLSTEEVNSLITSSEDNIFVEDSLEKLTGTYKKGDMAIIKQLISTVDGTSTYSYTAYFYDGENWVAMDGNYNATNVYFGQDLTLTAPIGVQTIPSSGSKVLSTTGKNLKQVLDMIVAQEKDPTATAPAVSVTLTGAKAVEAGTTITPSYSASLNAGSYTYGPATGITASSWAISDSKNNTATTASGTFDSFKIAADETYKITAVAQYEAGAIPLTNLGNPCPSKQIAKGSKTGNSGSYTGYNQGYYIGAPTIKMETITSDNIRKIATTGSDKIAGIKKNGTYGAGNIKYTVPAGTATIIVACPANKTGVTKVFNESVFAEMTTSFVKQTVKVAGADNDVSSAYAIDYNVWTYSPAEAYANDTTLTITLG